MENTFHAFPVQTGLRFASSACRKSYNTISNFNCREYVLVMHNRPLGRMPNTQTNSNSHAPSNEFDSNRGMRGECGELQRFVIFLCATSWFMYCRMTDIFLMAVGHGSQGGEGGIDKVLHFRKRTYFQLRTNAAHKLCNPTYRFLRCHFGHGSWR